MSTNIYTKTISEALKEIDPNFDAKTFWTEEIDPSCYEETSIDCGWELAIKANTGSKRPEHAVLMKIKTKEYWNSPAGMEKRKRLSERNRLTKSAQIKQAHKDGRMNTTAMWQPKYKPMINNMVFESVIIASNLTNVNEGTIRWRCHNNQKGWSWA